MNKSVLNIVKRKFWEIFWKEYCVMIGICIFAALIWHGNYTGSEIEIILVKIFSVVIVIVAAGSILINLWRLGKRNSLLSTGQIVMARITPEMVVYYNNSIEIFATYGSGDTRRVFREIYPVKKEKLYRIGKALENMYCIPVVMDPENELMYVVPLKEIIWFIENRRLSPSEKLDVIREINLLELMS